MKSRTRFLLKKIRQRLPLLKKNKSNNAAQWWIILPLFLLSLNSHAQTTCSSSAAFPAHGGCLNTVTQSDTVNWFSFVADSAIVDVWLTPSDPLHNYISGINLYSGSCSGLTLLRSGNLDPMGLGFQAYGLSPGTTYRIKTIKLNNGQSSTFKICQTNLATTLAPCTCPTALNTPNNTCQLICNYDFDYYSGNLYGASLVPLACPWDNPSINYVASPDLFNSLGASIVSVPSNVCGYQTDYAGNNDGYAGLYAYQDPSLYGNINDREYIKIKLNQPMVNGQKYRISFMASLADGSGFAISDLGALITTTPISQLNASLIIASPQAYSSTPITNKIGWTQVSATWTVPATGTYEYLTIGQFKADANSTIVTSTPSYSPSISWSMPWHAYYYIDHVLVEPDVSLSVSATPNPVCPMATSTLTATNSVSTNPTPITYTWSPGTYLNATTGNPVYSTPFSSTSYTTTATLTNYNSCYMPADTTTITVLNGPYLNAGADQTICSGQSATLTGNAPTNATTYGWQVLGGSVICNSCSTTVVSPTTTTSYVYFGSNGSTGCADSDTLTVFVNPSPGPLVSPANESTCSGTLNFSIAGGPYSSYNWGSTGTPASGTGSTFSSNWSASAGNGLVMVTVTASNGCVSTFSDTIPGCCTITSMPNLLNTQTSNLNTQFPTLGAYNGGYYEITGKTFTVNGLLIVDQNMRWKGCKVSMGMDAKIVVSPGIKFELTASAGLGTWMNACNYLWDGIYVDGTNTTSEVLVNSGSVIEDAKNAIVSINGGKYTIAGSSSSLKVKLNKNKVAVLVKKYTGTHPGTIKNTIISCDYASNMPGYTASWTSSGSVCKPPYSAVSLIGVYVDSCTAVTIGDSSSTAQRNLFERLRYGIYDRRSTVNVWNNDMKYIKTTVLTQNALPDGIAVYAEGHWQLTRTLIVGRIGSINANNALTNCSYGVRADNYMNVNVQNVIFDTTTVTGITLVGCKQRTQLLDRNSFKEFATGIRVTDAYNSTLTISSNSFNQVNQPSPTTYGNTAIVVLNAVLANGNVKIFSNSIKKVRIGVWVSRVRSPKIYDNNPITFYQNQPATQANPAIGIKVEACTNALVKSNVISYAVTPTTGLHDKFFGIYITDCLNDSVYKNTLQKMGSAIFLKGADYPSLLACNSMTTCAYGINFNFTGGNYGPAVSVSDQIRWQNSTPTATGNLWTGCTKDLIGKINLSFPINWYYNASGPITTNALFSGSLTNFNTPILLSTNDQCNALFLSPGPIDQRDYVLAGVVKTPRSYDTLNYEFRYIDREAAYRILRDNPSWLSLGTADDSYYQSFYTTESATSIGKFADAEDAIVSGQFQTARSLVDAVTTVGKPEENRKAVMQVYIDTWAKDNYYLSDVQKNVLQPISSQYPVSGGKAVFDARNMLYKEVNDSGMIRMANPMTFSVDPVVPGKVYPNPTTGDVTLEWPLGESDQGQVEVFDLAGRMVQKIVLQQGDNHTINTASLQNGTYLFRVSVNGNIVQTSRIIVLKQD